MQFLSSFVLVHKVSSFYFGSVWEFHNWNCVPFEIPVEKKTIKNTVTLLEERSDKSRLSLSTLEHIGRLLMSQMGLLTMY